MGKAAVLTALALLLAGSMYSFSTQRSLGEAQDRVSEHQMEVLARNAALAGHARAQQLLADDFSSKTGITGTHQGVKYTFDITVDPISSITSGLGAVTGKAEITAVGTYEQPGIEPVTYTIESQYEQVNTLPDDPPPFMQYVLITEETLSMRGNVQSFLADGEASDRLNSNMHTNGNLDIRGNSVDVKGFGTYAGSDVGNNTASAFEPNYNPNDTSTVQRTSSIDIPVFDSQETIRAFSDLGAQETSSGLVLEDRDGNSDVSDVDYDFTTRGGLGKGTREDPYVWHVEGDLTISGDVEMKGYVVFVVDGEGSDRKSIHLTGSNNLKTSTQNGESNAAFYTEQGMNIDLNGGAAIHGQFFAGEDSDLSMHGTSALYGTFVGGGEVLMAGTPDFFYRPASAALTRNWQDFSKEVLRVGYSAW